jgi:hypothetical protein
LDPVKRHLEVKDVSLGEVAIARMQLRHAGAHREGQREVAPDAFGAALDRDIDAVGSPGLAVPAVVDDHGRSADAEPLQIIRRGIAVARPGKLLEHLRAEIGRRGIAGPDLRDDHPAWIAHQVHDRALDDDLRRHQPALQQPGEAEARRHFGKARQRLAIGQRDVDILGAQIELMGGAVDPEAHPRNRHLEPGPGALECRLDIRREPIQLDRTLHHAPYAKESDEDQHRGERPEPAQEVVRAAPDMAHRSMVQRPEKMARGSRGDRPDRLLPLTGLGG